MTGEAGETYAQRIEKGAINLTTCCLSLPIFRRGILAGSKSGGKYLLSTFRSDILSAKLSR